MAPTALSAVARISYLSSDVIVDVARSNSKSSFAPHFDRFAAYRSPKLLSVANGTDIGLRILNESKSVSLITVTLHAERDVLNRLISSLSPLASVPLVINVAIYEDLSDVLPLRASVDFLLHSNTPQRAHDNALLAARLAWSERATVLHIFHANDKEEVQEVDELKIRPFVSAQKQKQANGHHANGHGQTETYAALANVSAMEKEGQEKYTEAALATSALIRRSLLPLHHSGKTNVTKAIITLGTAIDHHAIPSGCELIEISLVQPFPAVRLLEAIPTSVRQIVVLEQVYKWPAKWTPIYLDILSIFQTVESHRRPQLHTGVLADLSQSSRDTTTSIEQLLLHASPQVPRTHLVLGTFPSPSEDDSRKIAHVPQHESAYVKVLEHVFGDSLEISNSPNLVSSKGDGATRPEFALGRVEAHLQDREKLVEDIGRLLSSSRDLNLPQRLHELLAQWLQIKSDHSRSGKIGQEICKELRSLSLNHPSAHSILSLEQHFLSTSHWIIGSDSWAYDLGSSGVHHAIASGLNVNMLILDNTPYTTRNAADPEKRKKDIGLYAMNYGNVYVASVAIYSSYGHVLRTLMEADKFNGPSVVLGYLPYTSESDSALDILRETKLAVDSGYWPLYRWNPAKGDDAQAFSLDSEAIKEDLQEFLDRQNHLSQLVAAEPQMASELITSLGSNLTKARAQKASEAYQAMLGSMDGPPLTVLFASDGGTAEKYAKRLATRAKARGVSAKVQALDSLPLDELKQEEYVAFVTSTAGQGEPPQNGRDTFKALNAAANRGDKLFSTLKYSVFAMGDSHYWPRAEDAHYYNKPGKDLDRRLEQLGGERVAEIGLGDDQDADGPMTGYKAWEPLLWKALGVDSVEVTEAEPEPVTNEHIKIASNFLRGTIAEGLKDTTTGALAPSDGQLTKFHGIYEQDDRDIRDERKAQGLEPAYSFMIRVRMAGGVCKPAQWLDMDRIADEHGNGTFKLTTRQTFQFHGVIKKHLKPAIQAINKALLDTIAACGDVNRNVLVASLPTLSHLHEECYRFGATLSDKLLPKTSAYHEIWLDKKMIAGNAVRDVEPMYGPYYLPRKFKIAVAIPPNNDVDIFANDVGFIAIADNHGRLIGFNVTAGGGMGVTHSNKKTYPRIGDVLGFCRTDQGHKVAESILLTQRDNGNRADRKNARLKYTIDRMGLEAFKAEVEKRQGFKFEPAKSYRFDSNIDEFGWQTDRQGKHHFTCFIENGRVQDEPGKDFKTGLREIAKVHKGRFRLTANQHLIISEVPGSELDTIKKLLKKYGLDNTQFSGLRLSSSACVAFPTCGLAMAESERYLPVLIDKVEAICEENGLRNDSIVMRMTGCPNGCARPYLAEVAFVGKAPGAYVMLLGGGYYGQRLNKIYRENVTEPQILAILRPMIKRYALERHEGEHFGDFVIRAGYISATTSGKEWYEGMGGEGEHREAALA
ncbi:sulfite reductase subunit beta [Serendipita vermifera]|nr:sulfite reductase subunit beta [Serendipita vermifera]